MLMQHFRRLWTGTVKGKLLYASRNNVQKLMSYCARVFGIFWKCARVGERLSPYVSLCCVVMAVRTLQMLENTKEVWYGC